MTKLINLDLTCSGDITLYLAGVICEGGTLICYAPDEDSSCLVKYDSHVGVVKVYPTQGKLAANIMSHDRAIRAVICPSVESVEDGEVNIDGDVYDFVNETCNGANFVPHNRWAKTNCYRPGVP